MRKSQVKRCPLCREPTQRGQDMSWLQVFVLAFGIWRGYLWIPGGYAHKQCVGALAAGTLRVRSAAER